MSHHSASGVSVNSLSLWYKLQCHCFKDSDRLNLILLLSAGRSSPQLDTLTKSSTLEQAVKASSSAPSAPPAPVGQRTQTGVAASRPTGTTAGSQKPPDLLEQRKGIDLCCACNGYFPIDKDLMSL